MHLVEIALGDHISERDAVRYAFRTTLPFRIRVPGIFRFQPPQSKHLIAIRNSVQIPKLSENPSQHATTLYQLTREHPIGSLLSDILAIIDTKASPIHIQAKPTDSKPDETKILSDAFPHFDEAASLLNEFVIAYEMASRTEGAFGCINPYRLISSHAFLHQDTVVAKLDLPGEYTLTDSELEAIFAAKSPIRSSGHMYLPIDDLGDEVIASIGTQFEKSRQEIFYHFEFEAKSALWEGDSITYLLMACVALESAHASLLRIRYSKLNPSANVESATKEFLAKAGISKTLELVAFMIMDEQERPPSALLRAATRAITVRNHIVHANRSRGEYSMRSYLRTGVIGHGRTVMELLQYYKSAIEKES